MVSYVCEDPHGGAGPHAWTAAVGTQEPADTGTDGITDELLDPLLRCVHQDDPFVEYGIVEYRLRTNHPALFHAHVEDRGHSMLGDSRATATSVRFATTLGRLARQGVLLQRWGPATGAWAYNGQVSYWARPPSPSGPSMTWAGFCESIGRSPDWTVEDVEELKRGRR